MSSNEKTGAVLVLGGGISGIQSALDLADSGFKVYLVDSAPCIGGVMAQLDKTFPTNDCSMCILAPKLVGAGRHPNIELITNAELMDLEGDSGNFKALILKHAKSVDEEKCTGCGACAQACPVRFQIQTPDKPENPPEIEDGDKIDLIISDYSYLPNPLIQVLLDINHMYNYLPKEVLTYISYKMDIPLSQIYRVATFYKAFSLVPTGKFHIKVCMGTACHVRGARNILEKINNKIADTEEGLFSLETVNCLGACALGPIMVIGEETYGHMTMDKVDKVLSSLQEGE